MKDILIVCLDEGTGLNRRWPKGRVLW